jgi:predicted nucleic acid-binding protein
MIVVSDTSPINYLILIDAMNVLPVLFGQVFIPPMVFDELRQERTPEKVRRWIEKPPIWLIVRAPIQLDPSLDLDPGEAHAISLAMELKADRLLIDERAGTLAAETRRLRPLGTLGVLIAAGQSKLLNVSEMLDILSTKTNFRVSAELHRYVLDRVNQAT